MVLVGVFWASVLLFARGSGFVVDYFSRKEVSMVTSGLCSEEKSIRLFKEFSKRKISFESLDLHRLNETEAVGRLTSRFLRLGVLLDLNCPRSMELLKLADKNDLFITSNSLTIWLIFTRVHISKENLEILAETHVPRVSDPIKFLTQPYENGENEKYLMEINKRVNEEFIRNHEKSPRIAQNEKRIVTNKSEIDDILKMKIFFDNEITLAVPGDDDPYTLYGIDRAAAESRPTVHECGTVGRGGRLRLQGGKKRRDLGNAVLKAVAAILQPKRFTSMGDLATRGTDVWAKMSYPHVKLLAEDLNFRVIIRFFDDYGWQKNGRFGHLMGFLQQRKADLSAVALILRLDRFHVVDYVECPFRLQTGLLFRDPPLSSVTNIFLLPFSKGIWLSVGVAIVLTAVALRCRIIAGKNMLPPDEHMSSFFDIADYIVGAVCQQGFSTTPASPSARTSILTILLVSLALFTSYSACIVALLQSPSSNISTVEDVTRSNLDVGIQSNFPLYKVLIQEAQHPVLKEFYRRKVLGKGEEAFCDRREGIEKMRTGMFAFQVELTAGYKQISETYEEREKCGVRELELVPKPSICFAVGEASPFREAFARRLVWQREAGLFDRSWKLWVDQKPKCELGRAGFVSVGLTEFGPVLQVFAYGALAAALVFLAEVLHKRKEQRRHSNSFLTSRFSDRRATGEEPRRRTRRKDVVPHVLPFRRFRRTPNMKTDSFCGPHISIREMFVLLDSEEKFA